MVVRRTSVLALLFLAVLTTSAHTAEPDKVVAPAGDKPARSFDRDIRPILSEHFIGCHGGDKP